MPSFIRLVSVLLYSLLIFLIKYSVGLSMEKQYFNFLRSTAPSSKINAWLVRIDLDPQKTFMITPAHVAVYSKDEVWTISSFLDDLNHLDWRIPKAYIDDPGPENDLAWCHVSREYCREKHFDSFLDISTNDSLECPETVDLFYRQPFDIKGAWTADSTIGVTEAVVYKVPSSEQSGVSQNGRLVEALDVGFRGMSGAVALKRDTTTLSAMFVKRGSLIPLKSAKVPSDIDNSRIRPAPAIVVPDLPVITEPSDIEYNFVQRFFRELLGLNLSEVRVVNTMRSEFRSELNSIRFDVNSIRSDVNSLRSDMVRSISNLEKVVLKKSDLKELAAMFDARRGVFLAASSMPGIMAQESVSIHQIKNTAAPIIDSQ